MIAALCNKQLQTFIEVCEEIHFPVALEKTFWNDTVMIFLGLLLDSEKQLICIPLEKLNKARDLLDRILSKKKVTIKEIQQVTGFLNFLCRCVVPGRVFLRRLYALTKFKTDKPHHQVKLSLECKLDLEIWKKFLMFPQIVARPFMDFNTQLTSIDIDMYSDASRNPELGFGAYCGPDWCFGQWDSSFIKTQQPSIEYLELFAVAVAIMNWIKFFKNKRILLYCDNQAVVHMINGTTSSCGQCMVLLRLIVLEGLLHNVRISARYVKTKNNGKADALSRLDFKRFHKLTENQNMNRDPSNIPEMIWPIEKIWLKSA